MPSAKLIMLILFPPFLDGLFKPLVQAGVTCVKPRALLTDTFRHFYRCGVLNETKCPDKSIFI